MENGVLYTDPGHGSDRAFPTKGFLDKLRTGRRRLPELGDDLWMLHQGIEHGADTQVGRVGSGRKEKPHKGQKRLVVERLSVDLCGEESGDHVVARLLTALLDDLTEEAGEGLG